jgi:hypothetical protein
MAVQTQIQTRRGSAATWTSTNPTLAAGEIGFESDTNKFKIGTGSTAWVSLPYASNVSPLTTKGDLYTYSTDNARLAVGANGETLVADSSTSTGLRYQAPVQQNPVLNSAMQVWQRGTSSAIAVSSFTFFGPDRWQVYRGNTGSTVSRQVTGDTTNLPNIQYCARFQRDSGNSTTEQFYIANNFETINSIPFAGKTVTFSFYARKGANYSATSSNLVANLRSGEGTDQNYNSTYTGNTLVAGGSTTLTTTWQRFTYTGTVPTTSTELCVFFNSTPTGTAGAADYFDITGVQVEVGSVATPFKTYAATIQGELAACMRYFQVIGGNTGDENLGAGMAYSTTNSIINTTFQVPFRTSPTVTLGTGGAVGDFSVYNSTATSLSLTGILGYFGISKYSMRIIPVLASGLTAGNGTIMLSSNSNGKLFVSAEL